MKKFTSGILRSALLIFIGLCCVQSLKAQVPVPEFTGTPVSGCAPLVVNFRDQSTGNPVFWNWDFGNGSLSNIQNPTAVYIVPGRYTVTLVVRNANGTNAITKTDYIVVNPSPGADFSANILTGCAPVNIQFTDASVDAGGNIVNWEWNFGDGSTSTQQNPLHQFDSTGFYTISLKVTSSTGCTNILTRPRFIRVVAGVTANFSFTEPGTCRPPFLVSFKDESSVPGNPTYLWDFGNSTTSTQPNPIANYAASGTYTVLLSVQSDFGCGDTVQKTITINGTTTAINSPDSVCLNTTVNFQNASNPNPQSSVWDFGNGRKSNKRNDTSSYSVPGSYAVKLINNYDLCSDSVVKVIYVRPRPTVDFTANSQISCRTPFVVNFTDISPNAVSWQWNFGDGGTSTAQNPSHQYNAEGSFNVTLNITDNRGCVNTITKPAFIRIQKPTVSLPGIPTGGCAPFSFSPTSIINSLDPVAGYFWDFGDGGTATIANPTHVYPAVGVFTVKLRITTAGGCTDSLVVVDAVKVGTPPVTNFTGAPTTVCAFTNVAFTDMSAAPVDQWYWSFGDGTFSSDQNPVHSYADTGSFTVSLIAYNNGCGTTFTRTQYIRTLAPVPRFTWNVNCNSRLTANFFNITISDPSLPTTYLWEFGDPANSTSNGVNPTFTYPTIGSYLVRLTVSNGSCTSSYPLSINLVGDIADFTLSKTAACVNEQITVSAVNSNPTNVAAYEWSIGGGPFVIGPRDYQFSVPAPGAYSIALRITDVNNCTDTKTLNAAVNVTGPNANFAPATNSGCNNTTVVFNDLSNSGNAIVEWFWDFGDGSTQTFTSSPFTHQYSNPGTFLVTLRVKDNQGCMDTFSIATPIRITDPVPGFKSDPFICPNTPLTFTDTSSGGGLTYNWDFGDGTGSTLKDPVHSYAGNDSTYTVKLVITDSIGCADSVTKVNYISVRRPKPAFDAFDTTAICPPIESRFVFRGQDYESFLWDFGDGDISTQTNPKHFYNGYGSFVVKLYLTGFGGCLDSAMGTVNIYNPYTSTTLRYNPITSCNSLMVDFDITTPPHTTFTFNAGDGFIDSSQAKVFQHYYQSLGYYAPYVALKDKLDCEVLIGGPNTIRILGALPFFGMDKKAFCDSGTILFQNYTIGNDPVTNSVWDFGDGITSTIKDPSHSYTAPGTYYPSLTVTTEAGCVKTLEDTVHIYATPDPTIVSDTVLCINELIPIQGVLAYPDTAVRWAWNFGNGTTSTLQNPVTRYRTAGTFNIQVATTNVLGCSSNTTKSVRVVPNPVINVLGNPVIPVGTGINLPVTYGPGIVSYTWVPAINLDCTNCPTPFASPKKTTKYTVNVTDVNDCPASADIEVVVVCNEKNYFLPNTFSPNNDGNNDVFYPRGSGLARVHSLRIFNRWGELVFERRDFPANDPTLGWDGTHKGKKADPDVYVYIVEWVCDNSVIIPSRGNVALIR